MKEHLFSFQPFLQSRAGVSLSTILQQLAAAHQLLLWSLAQNVDYSPEGNFSVLTKKYDRSQEIRRVSNIKPFINKRPSGWDESMQ